MARQPYYVNTTQKQMDVQGSFGGGMVTQAHPEKLRDDEFVLLENVKLGAGGVIEARGGYYQTNDDSDNEIKIGGKHQGRWKYDNLSTKIDIVALDGKLYKVEGNLYTNIDISGLSTFQLTRNIEAVQVGTLMYFATGSGLVKYDGTNASLVTAYAPNGLEALYIGTNGLASNPDSYLTDADGSSNVLLGVVSDKRYGIINQAVTFTAYVQKVSTDTLEYKFEFKLVSQSTWTIARDWGTAKLHTMTFPNKTDYMIRVQIRKQGTTTVLSQYILPRYKIKQTPDEKPEPEINYEDMKLCNRIFFHYDRIFLYGDPGNPDHLYISHLNKFDYYPRTNIIRVTDPQRGSLRKVKQFRSFLVCFTDGSIQMITGSSPKDYEKQTIHTTLGCKRPMSVQVMKNYIVFIGNDNGIYLLKSFNYATEDKMNVERIDDKIKDSIGAYLSDAAFVNPFDTLSAIYDDQYYLMVKNGSETVIYRFYYEYGVWVRDVITGVSGGFGSMQTIDNQLLLGAGSGSALYKLTESTYFDGLNSTYTILVHSKNFNFNMPHHRKKLKQFQLLVRLSQSTVITVSLYTDDNLLSTTPLLYDPLQNSDAQKLKIMASGRFRYTQFSLSAKVDGDIELVGYTWVFKQSTPK